jgi:hypothetical protein
VGPRTDLHSVEERRVCCPCRESNLDCLFTQLAARSLPNALPSPERTCTTRKNGCCLGTSQPGQSLLALSCSGFSGLTLVQRGFHNICTLFRLNRSRSTAVFLRCKVRISEGTPAFVTEVSRAISHSLSAKAGTVHPFGI